MLYQCQELVLYFGVSEVVAAILILTWILIILRGGCFYSTEDSFALALEMEVVLISCTLFMECFALVSLGCEMALQTQFIRFIRSE